MSIIREFITRFGFDVDTAALERLDRNVAVVANGLQIATQVANTLSAALRETVGASLAAAGAAQDMADRLETTTDAVQELSFAGEQVGTSIETIAGGLRAFRVNLAGAREGSREASEAFRQLGIDVGTIGDDPAEQMAAVARGLEGVDDAAKRAALAQAMFGRSAQELRPLLKNGGADLQALVTRFRELNLGMSSDTIGTLDTLGDEVNVARLSFAALRDQLTIELAPAMLDTVGWLIKFIGETRRAENGLGRLIRDLGGIAGALRAVATVGGAFYAGLKIPAVLAGLVELRKAFVATGVAGLFATAGPLLLGALVAGIVVAANELRLYLNGSRSLIGDMIEMWSAPNANDSWVVAQARALLRHIKEIKQMLDAGLLDSLETLFETEGDYRRRVARRAGVRSSNIKLSAAAADEAETRTGVNAASDAAVGFVASAFEPYVIDRRMDALTAESSRRRAAGERVVATVTNNFALYGTSPSAMAEAVRSRMDRSTSDLARKLEAATPAPSR